MVGALDRGPRHKEANDLKDQYAGCGLNARQAAFYAKSRLIQPDGPQLPRVAPEVVDGDAPEDINIYSDGSVKMPSSQMLALGGCGIWYPNEHADHRSYMHTVADFVEVTKHAEGSLIAAPVVGTWNSSTRSERAALLLAMYINRPLHVGIDNKAAVDKARLLIAKARKYQDMHEPPPPKKP